MKLLKEKIRQDALILDNSIIKVDSFLNHQMDIHLFNEMGKTFRDYFGWGVQKIVTCEASGIGIATIVAQYFGCDVVFAKKEASSLTDDNFHTAPVYSYTKQKESLFRIDKRFINEGDQILIIDDFLANGEALSGMISLVEQAKAQVMGIGVAIEKGFQNGGQMIRERGYNLKSLVIIDEIQNNKLIFRE